MEELLKQTNKVSKTLLLDNDDRLFLINSINQIFGEILEYAFISGSFAYGGAKKGKSDIDFGVVFNLTVDEMKKDKLILKIKEFVKVYQLININNNFIPDHLFPGEYMAIGQVDDAIAGRGFSVVENRLAMPETSDEYYLKDYEKWFQAWLTMGAFSVFLAGNVETFIDKKIVSWKTIILFILSNKFLNGHINAKSIVSFLMKYNNKGEGLGINKEYKKFEEYENIFVDYVLKILEKEMFLISRDNYYIANESIIQKWSTDIINSLNNNTAKRAPFLFNFKEVLSFSIQNR